MDTSGLYILRNMVYQYAVVNKSVALTKASKLIRTKLAYATRRRDNAATQISLLQL